MRAALTTLLLAACHAAQPRAEALAVARSPECPRGTERIDRQGDPTSSSEGTEVLEHTVACILPDGRYHGPLTVWYAVADVARVRVRGEYRDGVKHGNWTWYDDEPRLAQTGAYVNGKRDGKWFFFRDGRRYMKGQYQAGVPDGIWRWWSARDGRVLAGYEWRTGTGRWNEWLSVPDADHLVVEGDCVDGKRHGDWKDLGLSVVLHFDRGIAVGHWDLGDMEGDFVDGKRSGRWIEVAGAYSETPLYGENPETTWIPARRYEGEYRDGLRIGVWTARVVDTGEIWETIDYARSEPFGGLALPIDPRSPGVGLCPYPRE